MQTPKLALPLRTTITRLAKESGTANWRLQDSPHLLRLYKPRWYIRVLLSQSTWGELSMLLLTCKIDVETGPNSYVSSACNGIC